MPLYEYKCEDCEFVNEVQHGMFESPTVFCGNCKSKNTVKVISPCAISGKSNPSMKEMKQDLRENYGVYDMKLHDNSSQKEFTNVYNDIKNMGSFVADKMKEKRETNQKRTKEKQKEWMKGALKRTPKRAKEIKERRAKEKAKKRAIKLQS